MIPFSEIFEVGAKNLIEPNSVEIKPEDLYTIVFTSGTEGDPKAVMITQEGFISILSDRLSTCNEDFHEFDTAVSLAPFNHVAERLILCTHMYHFSTYCFVSKDTTKIIDDIRDIKPTILQVSPRFFNKIYQSMQEKIASQSKFK